MTELGNHRSSLITYGKYWRTECDLHADGIAFWLAVNVCADRVDATRSYRYVFARPSISVCVHKSKSSKHIKIVTMAVSLHTSLWFGSIHCEKLTGATTEGSYYIVHGRNLHTPAHILPMWRAALEYLSPPRADFVTRLYTISISVESKSTIKRIKNSPEQY